jgi:hypothetical protein
MYLHLRCLHFSTVGSENHKESIADIEVKLSETSVSNECLLQKNVMINLYHTEMGDLNLHTTGLLARL